MPPPHHHPPHHDAEHVPPPKPHWSRMEQMSDEDVLRYAPPEIRRLWYKVAEVEAGIASLHQQNKSILLSLERLEGLISSKT